MRTAHAHHQAHAPRPQRNWIAETLVVLGIVAFGLFVLALEGHSIPLSGEQSAVALPFDLAR